MTFRSRLLAGLVVTLISVGGVLAAAPAGAAPHQATAPLPADPKVKGYIGLCDEAGHNVVGGSVDARPFVWKAVATVPPPSAYQGTGQDAVLNVYQPRPDTLPGEWSGSTLTGASFYTNAARPAVQATYADSSLADIITLYPPKLDGLYVLRIYWGKKDYGLYSATYPATVIQVVGTQWHVVSGGTVDCRSAKATSIEQLTGVVSRQDVTPRAPASGQATAPAGTPRAISSAPQPVVSAGSGSAAPGAAPGSGPAAGVSPSAAAATSSTNPSSSHWVLWTLAGLVVVLAVALVLSARRRRLPTPTSSPPHDDLKD